MLRTNGHAIILLALAFLADSARAACTSVEDYSGYMNPYTQLVALVAKADDSNTQYVVELDPATCALQIDATIGDVEVTNDFSDATGTTVPANAAFVAGTDGTNTRALKTDAAGELQVDVASSALPTGAATAAKQDTGNTSLATVAGAVSGTEMQVDVVNLDLNSGAAGAATLRSVLATRHEAAATPVAVRLSNGSAFAVPASAGRTYLTTAILEFSGTNVTSGAWVELKDSIGGTAANAITVFSSCPNVLRLGTGAAASEADATYIPPGGFDFPLPLTVAASTRLSLRAHGTTCDSGVIVVNLYN